MALREQECALLLDQQGHVLGEVTIRAVRGRLLLGEFQQGPAFTAVAPLFAEHREAANQQLFSRVEELDEAIAALELRLYVSSTTSFSPLRNLSISETRIALELPESATSESARNGPAALSTAAEGVSTP